MQRPVTRSIILAVPGLLIAGVSWAQQPTQAQQNAIRQNCRSDYQSYCSAVPTGGQASLQCLQQHAAGAVTGLRAGGWRDRRGNATRRKVSPSAGPGRAPAGRAASRPAASRPAAKSARGDGADAPGVRDGLPCLLPRRTSRRRAGDRLSDGPSGIAVGWMPDGADVDLGGAIGQGPPGTQLDRHTVGPDYGSSRSARKLPSATALASSRSRSISLSWLAVPPQQSKCSNSSIGKRWRQPAFSSSGWR